MSHWLYPAAALAAVLLLIPALRLLALRTGFVDRPGGRKRHEGFIPPIGGLAVFPVFMLVALIHGISHEQIWFFAALTLLLTAGALDDRFAVPPRIKFAVQWLAAFLIVVPGGADVYSVGDLFGFGPFGLGPGAIPMSAIAAVLLINALNLMDGLDGLAGGEGFIVLFWLAVCGGLAGRWDLVFLPSLLMAALAGFLFYNMRYPGHRSASVFLGDSGSLALGLSLAWFAMHLSQGHQAVIRPVAVAWLLALPIYDTCGQFARRVREGRHPFDADHHHFHHHFIYAGLTPGRATASILALSAALGLIGVGGAALGVPDYILAYLWTLLLLAHIYMSLRPHRFRRLLQRLRGGTADAA